MYFQSVLLQPLELQIVRGEAEDTTVFRPH